MAETLHSWVARWGKDTNDGVSLFGDGRTSLPLHDVGVGGASTVKQNPYRLAPAKLENLSEKLAYILDIGTIEHDQSACSSPMVVVPKPDAYPRPCVDCRKVNRVTKVGKARLWGTV